MLKQQGDVLRQVPGLTKSADHGAMRTQHPFSAAAPVRLPAERRASRAAVVLALIVAAGWASAAAAQEEVRWHELVLDVSLDRQGAAWPPALSQEEKADIMVPEAMKARMLWAAEEGARRKLLVREAAHGACAWSTFITSAGCLALQQAVVQLDAHPRMLRNVGLDCPEVAKPPRGCCAMSSVPVHPVSAFLWQACHLASG